MVTDTVTAVTEDEMASEVVKAQMAQWHDGTSRFLDAANTEVNWSADDEVPAAMMFDFEQEDDEFKRMFNMPIGLSTIEEDDREGTDDEGSEGDDDSDDGNDLNAATYVGMEIGLRRSAEGDLQRGRVKRQAVGEDGQPVGTAHINPMVDTRQYEVEFDDGTTETLSANLLAENILEQVDEYGHKHRMLEEIGGYRKSDDALTEDQAH